MSQRPNFILASLGLALIFSLPLGAQDEAPVNAQADVQQPTAALSWHRTFMRDSGPASIAVTLPGGQNYCWDADACRLRYVWRGDFVEWLDSSRASAEVLGTIYYRPHAFPLRIGDAKKVPAEVRFRSVEIVEGFSEFHYELGNVEVRELIKSGPQGGVETTFKISGTKSTVFFVVDPGAGVEVASNVGKFAEGVLKIPPDKAKQFTVTFIEIPNREAVGYWSMDDQLIASEPPLVEGVKGRALVFDGQKTQVATGVKSKALAAGATFAVWAKLATPAEPDQICIGAKNDSDEFALGANLAGASGFGVRVKTAGVESKIVAVMPLEADGNWHHFAATLDATRLRYYLDGKPAGMAAPVALPKDAQFYLGSDGQAHFAGATLDEARIYARVLDAKEIADLYESERAKTSAKSLAPIGAKPTVSNTPKPATPAPKAAATPAAKATPQPKATPAAKVTPTPAPKKPAQAPRTAPKKPSATPGRKP